MYHFFTASPSVIKQQIEGLKNGIIPHCSDECFSGFKLDFYEPITKRGSKAYLGTLLGRGGLSLIKDFNKRFENLQIVIDYKQSISKFESPYHVSKYILPSVDYKDIYYVFFHVGFSRAYKRIAKYHMITPIMQFIRNYSPQSRYSMFWATMAMVGEPTVPDLLNRWASKPSLHVEYGNWCNLSVPLNAFMLLDNPESMNKLCEKIDGLDDLEIYSYYATSLFKRMFKVYPDTFSPLPEGEDPENADEEEGEGADEEDDEWDWDDEEEAA